MMTENPRYRIAEGAAEKAIESLKATYLLDSFDADLLKTRLTEMIAFFTRNARRLEETRSNPELVETDGNRVSNCTQVNLEGEGV